MNEPATPQNDYHSMNERLAETYYSNGRYSPVFLGVAGLGFIAIFLLTQFRILGEPAPQLLYVGGATLLLALAQIPVLTFAQRKKGVTANLLGSAIVGIFAILLSLFWQGITPVAILVVLITPLTALWSGLPRRYIPALFVLCAAFIGGILLVNANPPIERLQNNTSAAIASIAFLTATGLLLITITIVSQSRRFHSLQALLLTSFIVIVTIPTVMTAVLSAVGAYTNSQTQTFNTLQAIASLKENQIETLLDDSQNDTEKLLADAGFTQNALAVLAPSNSDSALKENSRNLARARMLSILGQEEEAYNEIMVLNTQGEVAISTIPESEEANFENQLFFRQGTLKFYVGFGEAASFGNENLIVASPLYDADGRVIRGVLVLRSDARNIRRIMESTPGFEEAETYLVDINFNAVTSTRAPVEIVRTKAALDAILKKTPNGKAIYQNYVDQQVLGYYTWFEPMQLAVMAEAPLSFVVSNSLNSLAGSSLLALFVVAIAIAAVAISARTISEPIKTLAETTQSFALGKLSARAAVDRADEIGALAKAYNQMAAQLQEIIGKLEQRVADRTQDLESQTLRLRVAAEIARDSASARDLGELLKRSAELISSRFNFYHTGIFILDNSREHAVLVASPTEAGRQMIANNHKLRVGEVGIVGRVSATGEPRITLDTGIDAMHFNNPLLPNTRSEMALPLKVESNVIGVLDIQSDQPNAFNEDDVTIMQIMADQLATAIERTRLLQEVEQNLSELESAYGRFTRANWERLSDSQPSGSKGYRFDNIRIEPVTDLPELAKDALKTGRITHSNNGRQNTDEPATIAIPIKVRGQTIGIVGVKLKEGYDENVISVIESATERLASALESARLYEEARLRADREQSISRVTTAISASTEYEEILQTTVREIGSMLKDTEVAIHIIEGTTAGKQAGQGAQ